MKILFVAIILFYSPFLFSAVSEVIVTGVVVSYNKKTVVLAQDSGKRVKLSRSRIPKHYKLKAGKRVHVALDAKKILKSIKKQEEKRKSRR